MIVEDESGAVDLLKHRLESEGYQVLGLPDSKDVISQFHNFKPDLILLDLLMPGFGGLDVCEMLNQDQDGINTPVIIVSGLNKEVDKKKAYNLGIVEYFVKPVDMDVLIKAIKKYIKD